MEQHIKHAMRKIVENNAYMKYMNIELVELREGYALGKMKVQEKYLNPYKSVHGGVLYSLADIISGIAACSYGKYVSTISGTMNYLKPAIDTEEIFCEANVLRNGNQISVYNVTLKDSAGQLVETGTFTFYVMNRDV